MRSRVLRRSRNAVLAAAVAVGVALAGPAAPAVPAAAAPSPGPKSGDVHTFPVPAGDDPALRALPARTTPPFSMLGLTWDDASVQLDGTAEVRTRDSRTGVWSEWRTLDADARAPESGPERSGPALRGGTSPLWTGPSDGVQLRVRGEALPEGLRVDLVDPGSGDDVPEAPSARAEATSGAPAMTSRAGWGADESMVIDPPKYNRTTKAVFVHHTAGTNDYTCDESARVVRGIFTYHVESQGWNDIGYHFLVDKCGKIFEGRAGGIDRPVQGAHTYGLNTDTSSISVLGDYMTARTAPVVRQAIAAVAAWKLGIDGHDPSGTVTLTPSVDNGRYEEGESVTLDRISGHRDGSATDCPGDNLYDDLPDIRARAAAISAGVLPEDYGSDDTDTGMGAGPGPGPDVETGSDPEADLVTDADDWATVDIDVAVGDFDSDGLRDAALTYRAAQGSLSLVLLRGTADGYDTRSPAVLYGAGGRAVAAGDLNGDGYDDLAVRTDRGFATFHGSADGLTTTGAPVLAGPDGVNGVDGDGLDRGGQEIGASFTARDTDGDGYDELVAGGTVVARGGPGGVTAVTGRPGRVGP
ncbi:N-acetylmuramoyl-L-alanine amidase [Streptomyces sp. NPDC002133]|uniref:N-acetylmuramoyl-L-alanine amidase n=1 Tax=Streptomyces sp. NPDC002133 TaxID=3154409 RepID=UPI00332A5DFF